MQIGIFANTFVRPTLGETLDAVGGCRLRCVQFDMACAGVPTMPDRISGDLCDTIRREMASRGIAMAAVSGTFNMIHPDVQERQKGLRRLREMASACERMGTGVVTLCTGTRDPGSMWRAHPDNGAPEAWAELRVSMEKAVRIAEGSGVTMAFEPEVSNVVDSPQKARRLLDEMRSPRLKVVMDPANIFQTGELPRMREKLDEAFDLLGGDIAHAHAKDLDRDGEAGHLPAGHGVLDYDRYLALLREVQFGGALVLHGLDETHVDGCRDFLLEKVAHLDSRDRGR